MKQPAFADIDTILFDLDGVLYVGDKMIDGADTALHTLKQKGFNIAGVTNTTTQSRQTIANKLAAMHIPLTSADIYTPAALVKQHIRQGSTAFFVRDALKDDLKGVTENNTNPDYIVMGDVGGEGYSPETLRDIFRMLMDGAKLLALHRNRFWQKPDGLHLDLGVFVAAMEYASGQTATILGKPSSDFFHNICLSLHSKPKHSLMIGDDIESDIGGAKHAGIQAILVHTGKYRADFVEQIVAQTGLQPDASIASIAKLPSLLIDSAP